MAESGLHYETILDVSDALRERRLSPVELARAMLDRIATLDPSLHAYALVTPDLALEQARQAEAEIGRGNYRGRLHGVPIAVKDLCYTAGIPTAAGMTVHAGFQPDHDATVVRRLADAGAVLLGKLQLTEGAFSEHHPTIEAPRNPWNEAHWSGASSSGSGVATAAGLCFGSLGSDTGGSIRFPSAANGITGLKPTWGRVSRHGVFALADSLDHVGPMTRSAADAGIMLGAIAGSDPHDPTALAAPVPDYLAGIGAGVRGLRIGVDPRYNGENTDSGVTAILAEARRVLEGAGAAFREVEFPSPDAVIAGWVPLCGVETAIAHEATYPERAEEYGPALRKLLDVGRGVDAARLMKIQHARLVFSGALSHLLETVDLLLVPVHPFADLTIERKTTLLNSPEGLVGALRYTAPFDMSGSPTITLPGGFTADGLPVGFQLVSRHLDEALLVRAGFAYQQATDWHRRHPSL
jgi:amidase